MTTAWLIFKSFIGKALDLLTRYPLQILLVLVCLYALWKRASYDAIVHEYANYKTNVAYQATLQKAKNEILRKQAEASVKEAETIYDNNLKAIKNEYLKKQKLDSITIGNLRNSLREQVRADSFTVPETPADTASAEEWRKHYATAIRQYETLVDACRLTTNDFNLLRDWADISCLQVGCESIE